MVPTNWAGGAWLVHGYKRSSWVGMRGELQKATDRHGCNTGDLELGIKSQGGGMAISTSSAFITFAMVAQAPAQY